MNTKKGFRLRVGIPSREDYIVRSIVMGFKCQTEACTLSQWLFKNLRNATFTRLPTKALDHYLHEKDVPALETMEESSKLIAAVEYGVLDFALLKVYPQPMQTLICDISPIISITSVCILSSMSPESDDSEVMSLVVLDTFVLSFTIGSLLFVSIIAFAFSSILHKRKANVTTLLKHIWIFTADILQNR